nr:reverse transcriptase domain-containing protein [Tanacetum cinerariifolium]
IFFKLARDQTFNPTSSTNPTLKGRIRRSSKQKVENSHFEERLTPVDTMTDNRTMAQMLRAPIEGCAEAIVVPPILAEHIELKHSLINMMTLEQFFRHEKDNPHDHVRWFNKITSTIKYKDVPNSVIKLILFPFSLAGAARRWLEKEPPRSITTWDDLAWERYKDLLRACSHHGFTELHQLDTFYNALNPADQDSLNAAAGGNLLEKSPQDALTIIENKSKCLAAGGNTFPEYRDNIQGYISAAAGNYNQGNPGYHPQGVANQKRLPEEDACVKKTYTDPDHADTTYSANSWLEEFADELALISYPPNYDDNRACDIESDIREIEFLLYQDDVLPYPDNEDKVFNPGILSHKKSVKIITHVTQEKKLAVSLASWLFEDFDPPFSELLVFKEVPNSMRLLPFSSKNEEKVFKPGIYTFKKFHCCFLLELSHP